ncbi:MAG: metalloregulator ArsR/SmtB family transcription factor, partial [Cyanobacteria bacterium P01_H01_bin.152]
MARLPATTDVFAAIADPTRRSLLDRLRAGEQPVKQLAAPFEMSAPAISQHLSVL